MSYLLIYMEKNQIYLEDNLETLSKMSDDYYDMVIIMTIIMTIYYYCDHHDCIL